MRKIIQHNAAASWIVFLGLATNTNAEPVAKFSGEDIVPEQYLESVKISGSTISGIAIVGENVTETRPSLRAFVPENWAREACVQARTLDGRYEVVRGYKFPENWAGKGVVEFEYKTRFPEITKASSRKDFSVAITKGNCEDMSSDFLPSYWNIRDEVRPEALEVQVNSLAADEVVLYPGMDPSIEAIECEAVDAVKPRTFDYVCVIPIDQITSHSLKMELNVSRAGVTDPATFFKVDLKMAK